MDQGHRLTVILDCGYEHAPLSQCVKCQNLILSSGDWYYPDGKSDNIDKSIQLDKY